MYMFAYTVLSNELLFNVVKPINSLVSLQPIALAPACLAVCSELPRPASQDASLYSSHLSYDRTISGPKVVVFH
jgi:hypothetical protein